MSKIDTLTDKQIDHAIASIREVMAVSKHIYDKIQKEESKQVSVELVEYYIYMVNVTMANTLQALRGKATITTKIQNN